LAAIGTERETGGAVAGPFRTDWRPSLGAWPAEGGAKFCVWSPEADRVAVVVQRPHHEAETHALTRGVDGTFGGFVAGARAGDRYRFRIDDRGPFPDPASRSQPDGVHEASELIDPATFAWTDGEWRGLDPGKVVVYELHVGTFSPKGTFAGVTERLPYLRDLGVTAVELMPVFEFEGTRSWGYDGVAMFAPTRNYGRPDDLRKLVGEAHRHGIGVFFDLVYNHFGPVGNYAMACSDQYLSTTHSSAWAACVNLDGPGSEQVRKFFIENARHWVHEYHADGLRLDATHALIEDGPKTVVRELVEEVHDSTPGRKVLIVAEDHRNLNAMVRPLSEQGWGLDGVWADDLHHQVRRNIAGDDEAYYRDYTGAVADIVRTVNQGWFYTGQHSVHNDERRGTDPAGLAPSAFYVCIQNHDQVGNRAQGDRLTATVGLPAYRAASALLLTLPHTPLLFNGQEWAAGTPFQYFTDHDAELGKVVTEGRRREFKKFKAFEDPHARETIPDPQDPATFERSKLDWAEIAREPHAGILRLYQALLKLRNDEPALRAPQQPGHDLAIAVGDDSLLLRRAADGAPTVWVVVNFAGNGTVALGPHSGPGQWDLLLNTEDPGYAGEPPPAPPAIDLGGSAPVMTFAGPAAVVTRQRPAWGN